MNWKAASILILLTLSTRVFALEDIRKIAPAFIVDIHCHQEVYPSFWQALRGMKMQKGHVVIDAELALKDVKGDPVAGEHFYDNCLISLLREHVRPMLDEAISLIVKQADLQKTLTQTEDQAESLRTAGDAPTPHE